MVLEVREEGGEEETIWTHMVGRLKISRYLLVDLKSVFFESENSQQKCPELLASCRVTGGRGGGIDDSHYLLGDGEEEEEEEERFVDSS